MKGLAMVCLALALVGAATAAGERTRRPVPAVSGTTLDGKTVSLAAMRGKPVFINVWSSW